MGLVCPDRGGVAGRVARREERQLQPEEHPPWRPPTLSSGRWPSPRSRGRAAEPREMAEWVLMAGGPRNTYMTGENIIVSGGYIYA